jgi:hypothetical protein
MNGPMEWSFLWERPGDFIIVTNSATFPEGDIGLIFDKETRTYLHIEDDALVKLLMKNMRQAGVQCVELRDFRPEPSDATKIIENGLSNGLSLEEINQRLKQLPIWSPIPLE